MAFKSDSSEAAFAAGDFKSPDLLSQLLVVVLLNFFHLDSLPYIHG